MILHVIVYVAPTPLPARETSGGGMIGAEVGSVLTNFIPNVAKLFFFGREYLGRLEDGFLRVPVCCDRGEVVAWARAGVGPGVVRSCSTGRNITGCLAAKGEAGEFLALTLSGAAPLKPARLPATAPPQSSSRRWTSWLPPEALPPARPSDDRFTG